MSGEGSCASVSPNVSFMDVPDLLVNSCWEIESTGTLPKEVEVGGSEVLKQSEVEVHFDGMKYTVGLLWSEDPPILMDIGGRLNPI